ncbi:MAG: T9SS type A sorting domain-containing protein [Candidatus Cloacimonetes bacterium]|nr:T9SS type A sorting domain-containing protein [Candidatus Cloacimonadota bacterium]
MPGYEVIGFYNYTSHPWYYYDALHCRTMGIFDRYMLRITHRSFDTEVPASEEFEVIVTIDDRSEAGLIDESLKVYWRTEGQIPWNNVQLTEITGIDSFVAYIPGQPVGTTIEYYISASDYSGRTETLPCTAPDGFYNFTVIETSNDEFVLFKHKNLLYQNYPNPFNPSGAGRSPSTTISFSVPQTSPFVTLKIFNIKGQKVRTLFKGKAEEGKHTVIWNGTNDDNQSVSSGIYFYKLKSNNYTEVKKCVLLK